MSQSAKPVFPPLEADSWPIARQWSRLDDLCEGVFDCPHTTPVITNEGPYVVRSQDVRTGIFRLDQAAHVSEGTYQERIARAEPRFGDILYSREGTYFGLAAEVPRGVRVCLGQRMVLIRPSDKIDTRFLRLWLNSPVLHRHIMGFRDGTVAERLNMPTIRGLPVPHISLPEQRAIAATLVALDDKIELNRKMNATLEAMARALFRDWFVDFGPTRARMEGRAPYLSPDLWPLFPDRLDDEGKPEGWEVRPLADRFDLLMGQSPPGDTYNDSGDGLPFFQGRTDFGFRFPENRKYCSAPTRIAETGDTLVSVRAPVGDINLASERCCIGRGVAALRHKGGGRSFTYYTAWSLQEELRQYENTGTVFGAINKKQFETLPTVDPGPAVIQAFEEIVSALDSRIESNERESRTLAHTRDLLLPRLMSGEIRIRDTERLVEEAG